MLFCGIVWHVYFAYGRPQSWNKILYGVFKENTIIKTVPVAKHKNTVISIIHTCQGNRSQGFSTLVSLFPLACMNENDLRAPGMCFWIQAFILAIWSIPSYTRYSSTMCSILAGNNVWAQFIIAIMNVIYSCLKQQQQVIKSSHTKTVFSILYLLQ